MSGTPFERAVIGALVLIANASAPDPINNPLFSGQQLHAAESAVAPFLDETQEVST